MNDELETTEQEDMPIFLPEWIGGVPYCRDSCCQLEGGLCLILEQEPEKCCVPTIRGMQPRKMYSEELEKWRHRRLDAWTAFAKETLHAAIIALADGDVSDVGETKANLAVKMANITAKTMVEEWDRARIRIFSK